MVNAFGFVPILKFEKTDDGTLIVEGPATDSNIDRDRQIADPAWLAKSMPKWYRESGNIREQHDGKRAVGTAIHYERHADGQHWIKAEVVDPVAIMKVEKKVLRGFSFGARNARVEVDKAASGGRIVDGDIFEVSLVDRPANPNCMFTVAKADSTGDLQVIDAPELVEKQEEPTFTPTQFAEILKRKFTQDERDDAADSGAALPDGSFPIKTKDDLSNAIQAFGRAKDPAAAKAHIIKRARALGAVSMLPDAWNITKADELIQQVTALVPAALTKADDDTAEAFNPDTEAGDVDNGTSAITAIAKLIISEAEGLAAGRLEEICDIQLLITAAQALQCFVGNETQQETELTVYEQAKADEAKDDAAVGEPAAVVTEKTETPDNNELSKSELSTLLEDAITKATAPFKDELALVKAELVKVLETPVAGGPARTRTTTQSAVAGKADGLRREISLCQKSIEIYGGDLQKGYRERLATAEAELSKLDGTV
jgi:hypothetical protein